jgi:4-amino-4-deoxy-L-arabinose transferase-like glycosyltransferase
MPTVSATGPSPTTSHAAPVLEPATRAGPRLPAWWPLAALTLLAAALRLSTLGLQSFWYDEAFTPVHVLHASLSATLRGVAHTENSPPLWYLLAWADSRVLGDGEVALRLPSALAGIATVPVAWMIGRELAGRRAAMLAAALVAVSPLFVWYSQEARAYALFVLMASLAMLCFLRAEEEPTPARMAWFALTGALALLTHYFAVFLLIPMALWLLFEPAGRGAARMRRAALPAIAVLVITGLALLPLISAQGGHGTQWIGRWPLSERLQAIVQYYLTGYSGAPLGHGVELLVGLAILAGVGLGLWRMAGRPAAAGAAGARGAAPEHAREERGARMALLITACGVLIPVALAAFGADYLAPRNLVAAMIPLTALTAVIVASPSTGRAGVLLGATVALAFLLISIDVNLSPRLQRGNWRGVAAALRAGAHDRAITSVELGAAPLEYYLHGLRNLPRGTSVTVSEIDETGYAPLRPSAGRPPAPGFRLESRRNIDGLIVYRFVSSVPRAVSEATLRRNVITLAHPEVLVPAGAQVSRLSAQQRSGAAQSSFQMKKI